ncbi:MAG: ABC transporter permease [Simkaniaceae bacterium]|nr:ABC transporter permease [Simkaniaceae bacterium]MCF7852350.1 ABC transporter permease [Simkaniaceae bacterium]
MNEVLEATILSSETQSSPIRRLISALKREAPFAIGIPALIWQILFFYLPIALMILASFFVWNERGTLSFSIAHFRHICQSSYLSSIGSSLLLSFSTAITCFCIGFPLAHFIAFRGGRFKNMFFFLLIIPFWTNFLLHIYAWFFVLEKDGFLNTILLNVGLIQSPIHFLNTPFAVMLMMVYYYVPFMTLPIYSSLDRFDPSLLEASQDLGASKFQTFRRVLLPLTMNSIRSGFFLVFIPAFGEFVIPELMGGDKDYYIGSVISQFILGEETGHLGTAYTVISICALSFCISILFWLFKHLSKVLSGGGSR